MALKKCNLVGLSTDTKPTNGIAAGSTYTEQDTGKIYTFNLNKGIWVATSATAATNTAAPCVGIYSIDLLKSENLVDTYKILYTNGASTTFTVTNGDEIRINKGLGKDPLIGDKVYTIDLVSDGKARYQTYKSLHLDKATVSADGSIVTEALSNKKFWPRTEEGKFLVSIKDQKLELVFTYAGKNGTTSETWQAFALDQNEEFVRYVGKFYWTDIEDQSAETGTYYFKAVPQKISFKSLATSIATVKGDLAAEVVRAEIAENKIKSDLTTKYDFEIETLNSKVDTANQSFINRFNKDELDIQEITSDLATEEATRKAKDEALEAAIDAINVSGIEQACKDFAIDQDNSVKAVVNAYTDAAVKTVQDDVDELRTNDLTEINNNISTINTSIEGLTAQIQIVPTFNDRIIAVTDKANANETAITTEATNRGAADDAINAALALEAETRLAATDAINTSITTLNTTLSASIQTAQEAAISAAKEAANTAQNNAEVNAKGYVAVEKSDRLEADKNITDALTAEITRATTAETTEKDAREAADDAINATISDDITLSTSTIGTTWDGEVKVALMKDSTEQYTSSINLPTNKIVSKLEGSTTPWTFNYYTLDNAAPSSIAIPGATDFAAELRGEMTTLQNNLDVVTTVDLPNIKTRLTDVERAASTNHNDIDAIKTDYLTKVEAASTYETAEDAANAHEEIKKLVTEMADYRGTFGSFTQLNVSYTPDDDSMNAKISLALIDTEELKNKNSNDYVYVNVQDNNNSNKIMRVARFGYVKGKGTSDTYHWEWVFDTNTDSFTTTQLNAINSGITETRVTTYDGYASTIANKVDKVTGKVLSSNDYTDEDQAKLATIEENAQVNKIEKIKFKDADLPITIDKVVEIPTDTALTNRVTALESAFEILTQLVNDLYVAHGVDPEEHVVIATTEDGKEITVKTADGNSVTITIA